MRQDYNHINSDISVNWTQNAREQSSVNLKKYRHCTLGCIISEEIKLKNMCNKQGLSIMLDR